MTKVDELYWHNYYAGMAMVALLNKRTWNDNVSEEAFAIAREMLETQKKSIEKLAKDSS